MRNIRCRCCRLSMTFADSDQANLYYATIKLTLYSITIFFFTQSSQYVVKYIVVDGQLCMIEHM